MPKPKIPAEVSHDDFLAAIKPLLDLCGVEASEVGSDFHILGGVQSAMLEIRFDVVPSALMRDSVSAYAEGTPVVPGHIPPENYRGNDDFAELRVPVTVKVGAA